MQRLMMDKLITWKKSANRKPLILRGVRQVGKTYLLKKFGKNYFQNCHYFNFEREPGLSKIFEQDLVPKRILTELSFHVNSPINIGEDFVIFDEIQESAKVLTSLKYFQEDCPDLHLCGAGSFLGLHLNSGSFPVGKVTFETLRPMNFEEFLMSTQDKTLSYFRTMDSDDQVFHSVHEHLWEQLKRYFVVGGLPEVVKTYSENFHNLFEAFSRVRKKQEDLINTYYADIAKHSGKVNAMHIDRVLRSVPAQLEQSYDNSIKRFKFKEVISGITHYDRLSGAIDWLEAAGLVIKVHIVNTARLPFPGYKKENIFKLLLMDIGILGAMSNLSPKIILDYNYGSYKGYFAESFVAQELMNVIGDSLFSWQEHKSEIEFLIENEGNIIPVEVKSGENTKSNSLKAFTQKYDPAYRVVLSKKSFHKKDNTHYYPLYLAGRCPFI